MKKTYLGDGVFADIERGMLKLTTEDGIHVTNTIYLEEFVYAQLQQYVSRVRSDARRIDRCEICGHEMPCHCQEPNVGEG